MTDSEERSIGRLEAQMAHLARSHDEMRVELRAISAMIEQGKGARRLAVALGAALGSVIGVIGTAFGLMRGN